MKILITAFEPFAGRPKNQSFIVAESLDKSSSIDVMLLPVSFEDAHKKVIDAVSSKHYDFILMLGETAQTKDFIRLERVALNFMDSEGADNKGTVADEEIIIPEAPLIYFSNFPVKNVYRALKGRGYKVKISNSAGTFVCNSLYYHILHYLNENEIPASALFVHVPASEEGLSLDEKRITISTLIDIFDKLSHSCL